MKKVALEAWEKNKDKIRSYIEDKYKHVNPLDSQVNFVGDILNIAYKEEGARNNIVRFMNIGKLRVILFFLFTKDLKLPAILYTKYSIFNISGHPDISMDEKYDLARQIVLSATPINITTCPREWTEKIIVRKWVGFVQQRGIIT